MAFHQRDVAQIIWGVLLIAMGVLLCVTKPYAIRLLPESTFLSFTRYFIAVFLIAGGAKKLYRLYFFKDKESPRDG
jgi:drug/metabolite transporter (DMT)-like permease